MNKKYVKQSAPGQGLFYSELTAEESLTLSSKIPPLKKVLRAPGILPEPGEAISKEILVARITEKKICGRDPATKEVIPLLVDDGYLVRKEVPRPKARPEIRFVRTKKIPGKSSFKQTNAGIGRPSKITVGVSEEAFRRFADKENSGKDFIR